MLNDRVIPDEGQSIERKQSLGQWREIVESCAALATARGGRVHIGVSDDGRVVGVQIGKGTLEDLANKIAQNTVPKLVPAITTRQQNGATVIEVDVSESATKPVTAFGRALRRSGRTNQVLAASEIAELYLATRGLTWDQTVCAEASVDDIDADKVRQFLRRAKVERQWEIDPQTPVASALRQLNLLRNRQPTIAAVLLFAQNTQQFLVQAKTRCARYKGDDEVEFIDLKVIEGDVVGQVEAAMAFVRRNTSMAVKIEGKLERIEKWEYPLEAVREAITNAVCHRDYASSGNVQVRIFDHRLEVWNPGGLPAGLTVEDLRGPHESKPRNKLVADAFFLIKYIEQFGTGIGRMLRDCREAGAPETEFESRGDSFRSIFPRMTAAAPRRPSLVLNPRQQTALEYVTQHGSISRPEYEQITQAATRTAARDLADLVKRQVMVRHGRSKASWYTLPGQGD